ncbi:conserved exported hypothetical protein [Rubrivivax sp. A210]|uniref:hypothetical protein n=1 Tax=Rubrivivax sp. A210 TaxID=2772301 RepID=UPI001917BFD4|nr:hypothetical protein [Rubrivivax sp. A210]CAD5365924.1 conserved exported hypothetical protein [Rubrivivax sp. A210]
MKPVQTNTLPVIALAALAIVAFVGSVAATAALAAPATPARASAAADAQALYRDELAVCRSGASLQGRETCAYEAKSAYEQNRRGALQDRDPSYLRNTSQRCDALAGAERLACTRRMKGQGSTSGSAATGGIYRELVTRSNEDPAAE